MPIPNTNLTWLATGEPLTGGENTSNNDGVLNRPLVQLLANDNNLQTQIDDIISGTLSLTSAAIKGALSATAPDGIENAQIQTNAAIAESKLNLSLTSTTNVTTGVAYVDTAEMATLINSLYNAQVVSSSAIETSRLNVRTQIPSGFLSPFNLPQDDITRGTVGVNASSDGTLCTRTDKYDGVQIPWGDKFLNKLHVNCDGIIFSLEGLNTDIINDTLLYKAGTFDRYVVSTEEEINQDPDIDTGTNQITVSEVYEAGTLVRVESSGTIPTPLAINTDYYVIYVDDTTIQLATNLTDALSSQNPINITDDGVGSFKIHRYIGDLNQGGNIQYLACDSQDPIRQDLVFIEFWAENVDNTDGWVFPNGQVQNGNEVLDPSGSLPAEYINNDIDYLFTANAVKVSDTNFLSEYIGNRKNYTWVQENGQYAQWRYRVRVVEDADSILNPLVLVQGPKASPQGSQNFSLSPNDTGLYKSERTLVDTEFGINFGSINTTTNEITVTVDYDNGTPDNGRLVRVSSTGNLPDGLLENVDYFVIRVNATTIKLATSYANAIAGTAIDLGGLPTGFMTIERYDHFNDEKLVSGFVGAVPICAIHRRNRGAFHPSWNPNGTAVIVQPTTVSRSGSTTVSASVYEPFGEGIESSFTTNYNNGVGGFTLNEDLFDPSIIGAYCPVTRQWDALSNLGETSLAPGNVNTGTNQLIGLSNQWYTGEAFVFRPHFLASMPSGLTERTRYYARNVTASSITIHPTYTDAINGTNTITISSVGSGNWDLVVEDSKYDGTNYWYRSGYTASGTSGRPDDLFYDRVDRYDIEDQRHRVTFDGFDVENLMINNMNLLFQGGLLNDFNEQFIVGPGEDYTISSGIKGRAVLSIDGLYNSYPSGAEAGNSVVKLLDFSDGVYVHPSTGVRYKQRAQVDDLRKTWSDAPTVSTMTEELEYPVTPGGLSTQSYAFSKITTNSSSLDFSFQFNADGGTHYVESVKVQIIASQISGDFENSDSDPLQRVVKLVAPDVATSGPFKGSFFLGLSTDGVSYTTHRVVSPNYNYRTDYTLDPDGRSLEIDLTSNEVDNGFEWDETTETLYVRWSFTMEYPAGGGLTNPIVTQFDLVERDKIKRNYKNTRDCYLVEEKRGFYEASPTHWDRRGAMQRLNDFAYDYYGNSDTAFITERWGDGWFPTRPEDCKEIIIPGNSSYRIYIDDVLSPRLKGRWGYIDKVHIETGSTLGNLTTWSGGTGTVDFTDFDIIWHRPAGDLADRQWIEIENKNIAPRFVKFAFSYTSIVEYIKPSNNIAGDDPISDGPLNYVGKAFETVNQTKEFSYNGDKAIQRYTVGGAEVDWDGWITNNDPASRTFDANNTHYGNSAASPIAWIYSPSTASSGAQDDNWHMTYVGESGEVVAYISSGKAGPDNFRPYFTGVENEDLDGGNTEIYVGGAVSQFTVGDEITFKDFFFQTGITQLLWHEDTISGFVNNKDWYVDEVNTANQTIKVSLSPTPGSPETFISTGTYPEDWNGIYKIKRRENGYPTEPSDIKADDNIGGAHGILFSELNPSVQSFRTVVGIGNVNTVWQDHVVEHYHIQGNTYSHLFARPSLKNTTNIHLYSTTSPKNVETSLGEVKGILQVDSFYTSLAGSGGRREIMKNDLRFWDSVAQDDVYAGNNRTYEKVQGEFMLFRYLAHYINTTKPKYYYNPNEHMYTVPFDLHAIHQLYVNADHTTYFGPQGTVDDQYRLMDYDYQNVDNSLVSFQHNRLGNSSPQGREEYPSEPWKYGQNGLTAGRGTVDPSETLEALSGEGLGPTIDLYEPFVSVGTPAFLPQNLKGGGDYMMIVPNMYIDEQEIKGLILESSSYNYPSFQAHQIDTRFTLLGRPLINRKDNT